MLQRLYADNFRCLVNFEFRPSAKQLVIGRNGTGKSTALDVLSLLRDFSVHGLPCEDRLGEATRTRWQPDVMRQRFELDARCGDSDYQYVLVVEDPTPTAIGRNMIRVKTESVTCGGKPVFLLEEGKVHLFNDRHEDKVQFDFDWRRSGLAIVDERKDNQKLSVFRRWLGGIVHVQMNPWAMLTRSEHEARAPQKNLGNFADWYRHLLLDSSASVHAALADLKEVIPGLEALDAKEAGLNVRVIQATIRSRHGSTPLPHALGDLSEGQRALIALYVLTNCAITPDATLLIDEPDNFIALAEIQPWLLKTLDRVDVQQAQVILVSHHPELLNQMASQGGVLFERPDEGPTRALPFAPSDDSGLTPAEIIARGWEVG